MPARSIISSYNKSIRDINNLQKYVSGSINLDAKYQYLIVEVVMLRLFSILEISFEEIAFKLACGSSYRNGNSPALLYKCKTIEDAYDKVCHYQRKKPLRYPKWTTSKGIKKTVEKIFSPSDHYLSEIINQGSLINEMRIIRNRIAHQSKGTKKEYRQLITGKYGANKKIQVGSYLTSSPSMGIPMISTYIMTCKTILDVITQGK